MIAFIVLIYFFYFIYYRFTDDFGTIDLLQSLNPSTLPLNDLGVVCRRRDSVQCVSEFVSKSETLSTFRFGVDDLRYIRDEDVMEMWKTIIGCKHIKEVYFYHVVGRDVEIQCRKLKQTLAGVSQTQRGALDWRRVRRVYWRDRTDITDIDEFNYLVPSLRRK